MSSIDSDPRQTPDDPQRTLEREQSAQRRHAAMSSWQDDSRKDPEELEREIDETRAEVQATLHALERKLSPEVLFDQTFGRMREHGGEFVHNLSEAIKHNPMPVLLTSIGIAWLMFNGRRENGGHLGAMRDGDSHERWTHTKERMGEAGRAMRDRGAAARDKLEQTGAAARDGFERSREALSRASHAVGERSGRAAAVARDEWRHARSTLNHLLEEQPLVLGALGLAAGAIVGAALPPTEEEDRMLGRARDRALDRAKKAGEEGYRHARRGAEQVAEQAKESLRADGGEGPDEHEHGRSEQSDRLAPLRQESTTERREYDERRTRSGGDKPF